MYMYTQEMLYVHVYVAGGKEEGERGKEKGTVKLHVVAMWLPCGLRGLQEAIPSVCTTDTPNGFSTLKNVCLTGTYHLTLSQGNPMWTRTTCIAPNCTLHTHRY